MRSGYSEAITSLRSRLHSEVPAKRRSQPVDATPSDVKVVFMRQGRRYGLSAAQKTDIWRRWKAGESLHEIGRAFVKDHGSIHFLLSQHGGIAPAVRQRSQRTLTVRRTGRHLPRHCFRFVDSRDSQRVATGSADDGEPGGGTQRRPVTLSDQRSRSAGLEDSSTP